MKDKIKEALGLMDAMDDDQWTADGAPKVEAVASLGEFEGLKRADIIDAAPKFSRDNPDTSDVLDEEAVEEANEDDEQAPEAEENTQGWKHPEILEAQEAYDEIVQIKAQVDDELKKRGDALSEVTNRLMLEKSDPQANQREIMRTIKASNAARAGRVENFQTNRALLMNQPPKSPLDTAMTGAKKVRPIMGK